MRYNLCDWIVLSYVIVFRRFKSDLLPSSLISYALKSNNLPNLNVLSYDDKDRNNFKGNFLKKKNAYFKVLIFLISNLQTPAI